MAGSHEAMELAEKAAHAAHGGGHGGDRLGMWIGVTMAMLGVLLALCSAFVGSERTQLLSKMIEEEHAHAKYQAQDVKHRMAFLTLSQAHALAFGGEAGKVNKADVLVMANTVDRYLEESALAKAATNSYQTVVRLHMEAQEGYEHGLLAAEIGIVVASVALMLRMRSVWLVAVAMGVLSAALAASTHTRSGREMQESLDKIAKATKTYDDKRLANKTTEQEKRTVEESRAWASAAAKDAAMEPGTPAAAPADSKR